MLVGEETLNDELGTTKHPEGNTEVKAVFSCNSESSHTIPICVFRPRWMEELLPMVSQPIISRKLVKLHGRVLVPDGYGLACVPSDAEILSNYPQTRSMDTPSHTTRTSVGISCSYSMPKAIIAVVQTIYAAFTLYRTQGNQVQVYGYAAFGFTVTPYILMSIVNLVAQVVTPDYPSLFLVRSDVMDEAESRGGIFDGVVGRLAEDDLVKPDPRCYAGVVRTGNTSPQTYRIMPHDPVSGESSLRDKDSSEGNQTSLVASLYQPPSDVVKGHARTIKEWVFIPSCTKFRRTRLILDDTTSAPKDSRIFLNYSEATDEEPDSNYRNPNQTKKGHWKLISSGASLTLGYVSIIVLGSLSSFRKGQSSVAQRCWTMSWLAVGIGLAPLTPWLKSLLVDIFFGYFNVFASLYREYRKSYIVIFYCAAILLCFLALGGIFFVPAIGGLITVGKMLQEYGSCVSLS
jgi:hypothetical protein